MKRIGILFGQERTFPQALIERINRDGGDVVAEPVKVGGVSLDSPRRYDLILDRISQDIPFYRAILKKAVADGTIVVNNPFWWTADDKFFNNVLAKAVGVAVPKTVILPSNQHPPDTTSESMTNLVFPLEWDEIFSYIGFPAYFKPYSGGGWKSVYRVANPDEFFAAYRDSNQHVMTLQEEIVFDEYFRCYAIGRQYVHIMRYDPRRPHHERYVKNPTPIDPAMYARVHADCLKLVNALGYDFDTLEFAVRGGIPYAIDFLNPAPDADVHSVGVENFSWVVEHSAKYLVERAREGAAPTLDYRWQTFLAAGEPLAPGAGESSQTKKASPRSRKPSTPRDARPSPRGQA
jgi:hypothetical protein